MQTKAHIARKVAKFLGYDLRRLPVAMSDLQAQEQHTTSGTVLEFIGTQGIGKTTLHNAIHKHVRKNWFFREDIGRAHHQNIEPNEIGRIHREIFFAGIRRVTGSDLDAWLATQKTRQMSHVIGESLFISTHEFPRGFILEEGLVKNFPAEILTLAPEKLGLILQNRAFIYLRAKDPDVAASRLNGRIARRCDLGMVQHSSTFEKVRARVVKDQLLFDRVFEKARSMGRPAVLVHAEDDPEKTIYRLLDFEKSLRQ